MKVVAIGQSTESNPDSPVVSFESFWTAYPKKRARKDAEKAWARIDPKHYPEILSALSRHRTSDDWLREGGRFIPHAATYLNGERWTDELDASLELGQCMWNVNGSRGAAPRCDATAVEERSGIRYCRAHLHAFGERTR